jgi:hypothetical protein
LPSNVINDIDINSATAEVSYRYRYKGKKGFATVRLPMKISANVYSTTQPASHKGNGKVLYGHSSILIWQVLLAVNKLKK